MQRLHYSIVINAPKQKVWQTMLDDVTYRQWTSEFMSGSHFVGNWETGSKILFLAPNDDGKMDGMTSAIAENKPHDFLSIKHVGLVTDDVEDTTSDEAKPWIGAVENYTFSETPNGATELAIDLDATDDVAEEFNEMWPRGLKKLKELAEA